MKVELLTFGGIALVWAGAFASSILLVSIGLWIAASGLMMMMWGNDAD